MQVLATFFAPCGVAKADVAMLPIIGTITRGLQFLFVARSGTTGAPETAPLHSSARRRACGGSFAILACRVP